MKTVHEIFFTNSSKMEQLDDQSVDLVLTSPPYPMIEMWDQQFSQLNPEIQKYLDERKGRHAFERMHQELDKTWYEIFRVLKDGGIACINIGDATRKIGDNFQQFANHARILGYCTNQLEFSMLPSIIWRKQSNKPNKFMGSGMLPSNAYVTLEHEFLLVLRKGGNRKFSSDKKLLRYMSAYFWEERNKWFSDVWFDLKGISQNLNESNTRRLRSAAFPFELAYRLINMFSIQNDKVLDPFLGTGTSLIAAMVANRNSIGYEIDKSLGDIIQKQIKNLIPFANDYIQNRLESHKEFIQSRELKNKPIKYQSKFYGFKVITSQETKIQFLLLKKINEITNYKYEVIYHP